ncbi:putative Glycogen debranching enzyme [uncultured spirochete]|jgi:glycogen debranching enzyme|uniref:Putative Glycogen debranching enzyme n=1 Tax=uncultured spirochete TaxID=156406 RepID=A0A3P3XJA4_9SPIR|nr:putative Glycogen debranching enzyme [uncultured spirochete]
MSRLQDIGNGWLAGDAPFLLPFSGSRLQGFFNHRGSLDIALWGAGKIGSLYVRAAERAVGRRSFVEYRVSPNVLELKSETRTVRLSAMVDEPVIVVYQESRGDPSNQNITFVPAKNYLWQTESGKQIHTSFIFGESARLSAIHEELFICYENSVHDSQGKKLRVSFFVIGSAQETKRALEKLKSHIHNPSEANAFVARSIPTEQYMSKLTQHGLSEHSCTTQAIHCFHAAFSCVKSDDSGNFAGIAAGIGYSIPARSYFRDSYWTCLALLPFTPDIVRQQILFLEKGVYENGEAPSGLIFPTDAGMRYWEERKKADPALARDHVRPLDWWSDHFDSPLFFVNLVFDYIDFTADWSILDEGTGQTILEKIRTIFSGYKALEDADGVPVKPFHDRDWADNVFRQGAVTYDVALYYGALAKASRLDGAFAARAQALRRAAAKRLWLDDKGYFAEFVQSDGYAETHLAIETITAIHFGLATEEQSRKILKAVKQLLFTRNNQAQPFGDWGVMSVFPGYSARTKRRGKSLFPYRYHNGADWPYWDGLLAWILAERNDPDYQYALTRWWEYGLEQGWPEPVEYFSPPFGRGSPLQAWSSLSLRAIYEAKKKKLL